MNNKEACDQINAMIEELSRSGDPYKQMRAKLNELNNNAMLSSIRRLEEHPQIHQYDALVEAAGYGAKEEFFRLFEKFNPDPSWTNPNGSNLLLCSIGGGNFTIIKFLVEKGCEINCQGSHNLTPLICACMLLKSRKIIKYLLEHGADVSCVDDQGRNALFYAKQNHHDQELLNLLTPPITN